MSHIATKLCNNCLADKEIFFSSGSSKRITRSDLIYSKNTIFTHNGNLISYAKMDSFNYECNVCFNSRFECVYTKDGKYYTISDYSNITVIECEIKKDLMLTELLIMGTDIGIFIMPTVPDTGHKLLFMRGIKLDYKPQGWVGTVYSSSYEPNESSENNLMNSIFTGFSDEEENVYLIDRNGSSLEYETLAPTGEEYRGLGKNIGYWGEYSEDDWKIYANSKMRVKVRGYFKSAEVLMDDTPVGTHTKPALRAADE